MKICPKCGTQLPDTMDYCHQCGFVFSNSNSGRQFHYEGNQTPPNYQQNYSGYNPPSGGSFSGNEGPSASLGGMKLTETQLMVWSIIDLICCCLPFGVIALIFTMNAKKEPTKELQDKKLQTALLMCIIGTIAGIIVWFFWFFFLLLL